MAGFTPDLKLNVAIYGGGVTGATLVQALKDSPQLNLLYFDPKSDFTTIMEPFLSFYPSSHDALSFVSKEAAEAIAKVGWMSEAPSLAVLSQGPATGSTVYDFAGIRNSSAWPQVVVVQPTAFLGEMLRSIDPRSLFQNKTLESVQQTEREMHPLDLTFKDGSVYQVDVLVGDDGHNGLIRGLVLGLDNPATKPVFEHYLTTVGMIPPEVDQVAYLGPRYGTASSGRRFEHIADKAWVLNEPSMRSVLGTFYTDESYDVAQLLRPTTSDELHMRFGELEYGRGIAAALTEYGGGMLIPEVAHRHAPTYINGSIAMAGNSAHKMTSFQQLGFGQQVEDAMILGAVLSVANNTHDLSAALYSYDVTRRPRSQWVSDHAKALGQLWHGMSDAKLELSKLHDALEKWWTEWEDFDVSAHLETALRVMRERVEAAGYSQ